MRVCRVQPGRAIAKRCTLVRLSRDIERSRATFIDVLDRVLDKGIVIDGWGRVSVAGIDLIGIDAWVVVASIHTYLRYADSLGLSPRVPTSADVGAGLS